MLGRFHIEHKLDLWIALWVMEKSGESIPEWLIATFNLLHQSCLKNCVKKFVVLKQSNSHTQRRVLIILDGSGLCVIPIQCITPFPLTKTFYLIHFFTCSHFFYSMVEIESHIFQLSITTIDNYCILCNSTKISIRLRHLLYTIRTHHVLSFIEYGYS